MGHTCQGLSQSKGMGKAPSHAPNSVNIIEHWKYDSGVPSDQELKNILEKSSKCAPCRLQAGRMTKCDINKAQQKVSSVCSVTEAPNRIAITWKIAADPNTKSISFKTWTVDNLILDFMRISVKHSMANTKQNNLRDAAERVNNETGVEAKFEIATEVHAANTCTKLMVKKSFVV